MPNFGTIPPGSPHQEKAYQRGYSDGVLAALRAITKLANEDRSILGGWPKAIADWRTSTDGRAFEPPPAPSLG